MQTKLMKKEKLLPFLFSLLIMIALLLPVTQTATIQITAAVYQDISVDDVKEKIDAQQDIFLLDVRSSVEYYDDGHILGAVNINVYFIKYNLDKLPSEKDAEIIVYCDNGFRSATAAESLVDDLNFTNVFNMNQGFNKWKSKGYPYIIGTNQISSWNASETLVYDSLPELQIIFGNYSTPFLLTWEFNSSNPLVNITVTLTTKNETGWEGWEIGSGNSIESGIYSFENPTFTEYNFSIFFQHLDENHSGETTFLDVNVTIKVTLSYISPTNSLQLLGLNLAAAIALQLSFLLITMVIHKGRKRK
jgi:rhodanese-related sulfurtransferase